MDDYKVLDKKINITLWIYRDSSKYFSLLSLNALVWIFEGEGRWNQGNAEICTRLTVWKNTLNIK